MTTAFDKLHNDIQHILWDLKWEKLRDLQVDAINEWFDNDTDIILMANTASGKTEAAFLPILSFLAPNRGAGSIRALYVGPLIALINDQFRRLEELCKRTKIPVHRWHGDVSSSSKKALIRNPSGVLLITPESLEALLMRRGREAHRVFRNLDAVVIDELHVFLDSERGRQLSCLLARLDNLRFPEPRVRRIGLSATIGDASIAQEWLGAGSSTTPRVVESVVSQDIELMVKTFVQDAPRNDLQHERKEGDSPLTELGESTGLFPLADHMLKHFGGRTNLVFFNRKADIELMADTLGRLCERHHQPNEFVVHHGSVSKELRQYVEKELQSTRPCTALCSSTLELGIDVGSVDAIGQVDPPYSVSALKQRLGRSGRIEGTPSRLWMYVPIVKKSAKEPLPGRLYLPLVQAVALVELMLEQWIEPPYTQEEDMSTLIQQVLSLIVQSGGVAASDAYKQLCTTPAFRRVSPDTFAQLLKDLGEVDFIEQTSKGDLILGLLGERLTSHYEFYAAFKVPEEYEAVDGTRAIGSVSGMVGAFHVGQHMLLAGRRWKILHVDEDRKTILVEPSRGKQPVFWKGAAGHLHRKVREKMLELLLREDTPAWMEPTSQQVLGWARDEAQRAKLNRGKWFRNGNLLYLFTWTGSRATHTIELALRTAELGNVTVDNFGVGLALRNVGASDVPIRRALVEFVKSPPQPDDLVLKAFNGNPPASGKHDAHLSPALRARAYASANIDRDIAIESIRHIVGCESTQNS